MGLMSECTFCKREVPSGSECFTQHEAHGCKFYQMYVQDKGGRLNGPDVAEPSYTKTAVPDADLLRYGYAPGNYTMHCTSCKQFKDGVDKRCTRCRECAEAQYWHDTVKGRTPEPPLIVRMDEAAMKTLELRPGAVTYMGGKLEKTPREQELESELAEAQEEQREANRMLGEALTLAEQWKADCLKAWDRISELQKQIIAYDAQVEKLRKR